MKEGIHPKYQSVVFLDTSTGHKWLTRTTMASKETVKWDEDGQTYPVIKVDISQYSHPYFTGKMKLIDAAGRVEKFQRKYKWASGTTPGGEAAADAAPPAEGVEAPKKKKR